MADEVGMAARRRRRRNHSDAFKAQVVSACTTAGVSIAAVAMTNGINANLARRWVAASERDADMRSRSHSAALAEGITSTAFVPVTLPTAAPPADIRIELRRGATAISLSWPCSAAAECAAWLRELLR
jgi:transposase-like protein